MSFYIYLITNMTNNKNYIGKTNNPKTRWKNHKKIALGGASKYKKEFSVIHAAISKYGYSNFKFEVIEKFDLEDEAYWFETWWIEYLQSNIRKNGYNLNKGGKGGVVPNDELRQKLVAAQNTPKMLKMHSDCGKKLFKNNPRFLADINIGNQYRKNKPHTIETKLKMSEAHRLNPRAGEKITTAILKEYQVLEIRDRYNNEKISQHKLAQDYNVTQKTISDIILKKTWKHI